jgi:hypothetical protein
MTFSIGAYKKKMSISTVHLSSSNATTRESHGDFTVALGSTLRDVTAVELASASLPNTFANVLAGDQLIVAITGGATLTVALDEGSFTSTSILAQLKGKLDAADSDADGVYTCTYSDSAFRLSIARQGSTTFTVTPSSARLARVLGYPLTAESAANPQVAPSAAELGLNSVIVASKALRNPILGGRAATFVITQSEGSGGVSIYKSSDYRQLHHFQTPIRNLDRIDIKLLCVHADQGVLSTQGFPIDLVLRLTHSA